MKKKMARRGRKTMKKKKEKKLIEKRGNSKLFANDKQYNAIRI